MSDQNNPDICVAPEPPPPLPSYRCHKVVQAAKIIDFIIHDDAIGGATCALFFEDQPPRMVSEEWTRRIPAPVTGPVGGYYVRYKDGYESWSPASEFEDGYTRIDPRPIEELPPLDMLMVNLISAHYHEILWRGYHSAQGVEITREITFLTHVLDYHEIPHEDTAIWHDRFSQMLQAADLEKTSLADFAQAFLAEVRGAVEQGSAH